MRCRFNPIPDTRYPIPDTMLYYISRAIFTIIMKVLLRVRIYGTDNLPEPPFIITSNHASLMDPPLVGLACSSYRVDFMAKQELFDVPVIGAWTRNVGCIPLRRGKNSIKGIKEALRRLRNGYVVGVFPEGTRSVDGNLQEAKVGTGFLVMKARVPVVPVYVYGSAEAFPKGKGIKLGTRVGAVIGDPVSPEEYSPLAGKEGKGYEAVSNLIMDRIFRLKEKYESEYRQ
ncbi:MAG: 1-acyl-sn-glycerol-3-phosphate acyltransferase [Candidatus Omnitrophica bacterium]|nr:1-acyl-sn-glycerol-3-phosphate acyltransferase [Candidatus Omnitrophota bacterium]